MLLTSMKTELTKHMLLTSMTPVKAANQAWSSPEQFP